MFGFRGDNIWFVGVGVLMLGIMVRKTNRIVDC